MGTAFRSFHRVIAPQLMTTFSVKDPTTSDLLTNSVCTKVTVSSRREMGGSKRRIGNRHQHPTRNCPRVARSEQPTAPIRRRPPPWAADYHFRFKTTCSWTGISGECTTGRQRSPAAPAARCLTIYGVSSRFIMLANPICGSSTASRARMRPTRGSTS